MDIELREGDLDAGVLQSPPDGLVEIGASLPSMADVVDPDVDGEVDGVRAEICEVPRAHRRRALSRATPLLSWGREPGRRNVPSRPAWPCRASSRRSSLTDVSSSMAAATSLKPIRPQKRHRSRRFEIAEEVPAESLRRREHRFLRQVAADQRHRPPVIGRSKAQSG